jgi:hypothetical protein
MIVNSCYHYFVNHSLLGFRDLYSILNEACGVGALLV